MYGKIFESIYDGTIAVNWKAMVVFQQLIVLCDSQGVIDMTPSAISRRTNIPLDVIDEGLLFLSEPDKYSRSKDHEGRRIVLIDTEREWGWVIVNHRYYRDLASREDKREKDRLRIAEKRAQVVDSNDVSQSVAKCNGESLKSPMQDANTDTINTCPNKKHSDEFDSFWNGYPRKEGKKSAMSAFRQLSKTKKAKAITDSVKRYANTEKRFIPLPASYINGERWEDETGKEAYKGKEI